MRERLGGALPVVLGFVVGSVLSGHTGGWTGSLAGDAVLPLFAGGAAGLALTFFVPRESAAAGWAQRRPAALLDGCLIWVAYYVAYRLRFGNGDELREHFPAFVRSSALVVASQMLTLVFAGAYARAYARSSRETMVALATAVAAHQMLAQLAILGFWNQTRPYSRGPLLIGGILALGLLAGWRIGVSAAAAVPAWWRGASTPQRAGAWLAAGCALTGIVWAVVVPPFEAPDELFFCRVAVEVAETRRPPLFDPLFFRAAEPFLHVMFNAGLPFDATRNPAFRFISNQPGRVTMFTPGPRLGVSARELALLYLMRAAVLVLTVATTMLIYGMALAFFGRPDMAVLVAGLSFLLPQFSFAGSSVNPESLSTLAGAAAAALIMARATGVLTTRVAWLLLITLLVTAPFTDSAAIFLVPFAPVAMALVERGWKRRLTMLAALVAAGVAAFAIGHALASALPLTVPGSVRTWLANADLRALANLDPIAPFLRRPDTGAYLMYEFSPKMFFGFLGWLGQPSILLPASFFAAALVVLIAALTGLAVYGYRSVRRAGDTAGVGHESRLFLMVAAIGLFAILIPIVYSTVLFNRDEWYGRWLFPWLGPLMILFTVGVREFVKVARSRPHALSAGLGLLAVLAPVAWLGNVGGAVTAGIRANHYGDQDHLLRTIRYSIVGLALLPLAIELAAVIGHRWVERGRVRRGAAPAIVLGSAWAINLILLFVFVRPLYRPMNGPEYVNTIRGELARGDIATAKAIATAAVRDVPESDDVARLVLGLVGDTGDYDLLAAYARSRLLTTGIPNALEALMMARGIRASAGSTRDQLLAAARGLVPDEANDEHRLLALEATRESAADDRTAAGTWTGTPIEAVSHGVRLESASMRSWPDGQRVVIVYFRPLVEWRDRRLWIHAYPDGEKHYTSVKAMPSEFDGWRKGELAWEAFPMPGPGRFNVYVGVSLADDLGDASPIGSM